MMLDLSPKSLEVYEFFLNFKTFSSTKITHEYFQVAKKFIIPELEKRKDISLGHQFVISLLRHLNIYSARGVLNDTFLLDDIILNNFNLLSKNNIIHLMISSSRVKFSPAALAKLVELALSDKTIWINFIRSSDCLVVTGDDQYDASLRSRMLKYLTSANGKIAPSSYKEIAYVHYHNVYKHEDYKKFLLTFEPMLGISLRPEYVFPKIEPPLNRYFKEWAIKYMQDFYYTEVMLNQNTEIDNFKLFLILAFSTLVPENIRAHAKEKLSLGKDKETMRFLQSLETSGWIDDLENYYSLFLNQETWDDYYFYAKSEASRRMQHKWILKTFSLPVDKKPFIWEGFSVAENYIFTAKTYKEYHNAHQLEKLKRNIIQLLNEEYNIQIEHQAASLDILCSILETLVVEQEMEQSTY